MRRWTSPSDETVSRALRFVLDQPDLLDEQAGPRLDELVQRACDLERRRRSAAPKEFQPAEGSGWAVAAEERKLRVLLVRMNPDLAMGAELLKKTGAGNLFMVFGEPDVEIRRVDDGLVQVEIRGVDVYDPSTVQVRSSSTDDIACWFVDTNNEESFFVREAYFTDAGETRTAYSARRCVLTSTKRRGHRCTRPRAARSRCLKPERSP